MLRYGDAEDDVMLPADEARTGQARTGFRYSTTQKLTNRTPLHEPDREGKFPDECLPPPQTLNPMGKASCERQHELSSKTKALDAGLTRIFLAAQSWRPGVP